jgi:hypothetical protein
MTVTEQEGYSNQNCYIDILRCAKQMCTSNHEAKEVVVGVYNGETIGISVDGALGVILPHRPLFLTVNSTEKEIRWNKFKTLAGSWVLRGRKN